MNIADLSWPEYQRLIRTQLTVLPIGALEPHGPHLPLATDSIIADGLADAVSSMTGALVLPVISYGHRTSPIRMGGDFPGTVDLRASTLGCHVEDVLQACYQDGARSFLVLHAAYSNVAHVNDALARFVRQAPQSRVLSASWWDFATEQTRNAIAEETGVDRRDDHHAALVETSLVMHLAPHLVREHLIADDQVERRIRHQVLPAPPDLLTRTGVVYRAIGASAASAASPRRWCRTWSRRFGATSASFPEPFDDQRHHSDPRTAATARPGPGEPGRADLFRLRGGRRQ